MNWNVSLGFILQQGLETLVDDTFQTHATTSLAYRFASIHIASHFVSLTLSACANPARYLWNMSLPLP